MPGSLATIQGTADSEITPEHILNIGETLGMQYENVTIGYNMHPSSKMIVCSLIAGLTATGANVKNTGIIPTPVIPFASRNTDCCVMVGNPDDRSRISGVTFMNTDGRYFTVPQMFALNNRLDKPKALKNYERVGTVREYSGAVDQYADKVASYIGDTDCQIIIDCASGSPSVAVPDVMNSIGTDAVIASCQTDISNKGSWAQSEYANIKGLTNLVKANYGSIGVALNSDGSHIAAVDENGRPVSGDALLQILVKQLEPDKIAIPIDSSMAVKELVKGNVVMSPIDSSTIGDTMKNNNLGFGGSSDGTFVFKKISYASDGITAAALLAKVAAEGSLSDLVKQLPVLAREECSVQYTDNREIIARKISSKINDIEYESLCTVDGWRVEMESGWFLIRFSDRGTFIDIKAEGVDRIYVAGLMEIAKEIAVSSLRPSI